MVNVSCAILTTVKHAKMMFAPNASILSLPLKPKLELVLVVMTFMTSMNMVTVHNAWPLTVSIVNLTHLYHPHVRNVLIPLLPLKMEFVLALMVRLCRMMGIVEVVLRDRLLLMECVELTAEIIWDARPVKMEFAHSV